MQLQKIKSLKLRKITTERLWNLAVEKDESYVANKIVVHNCRSIWVEILHREVFKPKITGIPASIKATKTLDTAKLAKAPVLLKGSPAVLTVRTEIKELEKKLSDLKSSGKYPNRQSSYSKKIKTLKNAVAGKFKEELLEILRG